MRITTAILASAGVLLALTGCSSDTKADQAACKAAMSKAFDEAIAAGNEAKKSKGPAACAGVDDKTLQRFAAELISDRTGKAAEDAMKSAAPDATTAVPISDECRAWIKGELLDSSSSIDATAGQDVCGDLSSEELDQAIEDVTNELTGQGATATP